VQQTLPSSIVSSTASIVNNNQHRIAIMNKQSTAADNLTYSPGGDETIIIDE
jgi:hypothetical protein